VAADLLDTMRAFARCVGLAAPQIGELVRVVVVDCSRHPKATEDHGELILIDPVIVAHSGGEVGREVA
jgi:peptide deformylase